MTNANTTARETLSCTEATRLFDVALSVIESDSIRKWARDQDETWIKIIQGGCGMLSGVPVLECPPHRRAHRVATFIICQAMGF